MQSDNFDLNYLQKYSIVKMKAFNVYIYWTMSLCDGSKQLLENYGFFLTTNSSAINRTNRTVDSVFNHWCHYDSVPEVAHYLIGTILIIICTLSITGNLLVIIVFSR